MRVGISSVLSIIIEYIFKEQANENKLKVLIDCFKNTCFVQNPQIFFQVKHATILFNIVDGFIHFLMYHFFYIAHYVRARRRSVYVP